jgi:lysophospholipase L1-like esterase
VAARAQTPAALPRDACGHARLSRSPHFARYVAVGDSSTEGLVDPDGRGGYRGWSQRLAERIAAGQGGLLYANLAVRGTTTREIIEQQLARAIDLRPDLATVFSGTNDVMRARFERAAFARDVLAMQRALRAGGATVLTFTLPDLSPLLPVARLFATRIRDMNAAVRAACTETGTRLVDFAAWPVATDERLWNADRIHANPAGHARIAEALADALGLAGANGAWREPLPALPRRHAAATMAHELDWITRYLLPSCAGALVPRRWRGTHAVTAATSRGKRPELTPVEPGQGREAGSS